MICDQINDNNNNTNNNTNNNNNNKPDVEKQVTHMWMKGSGLKTETEGFIVAA